MDNINITFSTCWYNFKAKYKKSIYDTWIDSMLSNVNNYYLVIYTDELGSKQFEKYAQSKIKIIIKPYIEFLSYKYENQWISNHDKNIELKNETDWKVNMLWSEKINFVKITKEINYFNTEYFGWCDIGYFRNRPDDLSKEALTNWPNNNKINSIEKNLIHYALINNNHSEMQHMVNSIDKRNKHGLPITPIPIKQQSIAGGFFILHSTMIEKWHTIYYSKLLLYFTHNYLVKDDQMIILDCLCENRNIFKIYVEQDSRYDKWFMFQRKLL